MDWLNTRGRPPKRADRPEEARRMIENCGRSSRGAWPRRAGAAPARRPPGPGRPRRRGRAGADRVARVHVGWLRGQAIAILKRVEKGAAGPPRRGSRLAGSCSSSSLPPGRCVRRAAAPARRARDGGVRRSGPAGRAAAEGEATGIRGDPSAGSGRRNCPVRRSRAAHPRRVQAVPRHLPDPPETQPNREFSQPDPPATPETLESPTHTTNLTHRPIGSTPVELSGTPRR